MKIVAVLAIVSLAWSARQPGKENDAEDQMPETIWIGSPYGLIPYDIDWAYFNKTKEHVLREADKHRKGIKAHPSETTTAALSRKGSNEKHEVNGTLEDILSTTTIEPTTSLQSTTCNDEQEDNINGQFHTTETTIQISENEAARIERIRTASLNYANTASISHMNHTHRQRIPHKLSTTTSRISRPTTPSITQRTFPRIPYDIDDLLVDSTVPSTSLMDAFKKSQATALNTGRVRGNNATSTERKKPRKEYEATIAEKKEQPNMITSKGNGANYAGTIQEEPEVETPSTEWKNKSSAHVVETLSRSSLMNSANKRKQNRAFVNDERKLSNDRDISANNTSEEDEQATEVFTSKLHRNGNCNTMTDILAFSNYLQLKIINSLLSGSVTWPRNERGQFRGMVNHMRRKLQSMTKKSNDKEQFRVIHAHLVKYMGDNRGRQQLVLPIPVGDWGTVQQLLNCLKKKKL